MRVSIRYQVLVPLLLLLLVGVGISAWVAARSAGQAVRRQIELQLRHIARAFSDASFPLTEKVLEQVKEFSGADYVLLAADGTRVATLPGDSFASLAAEPAADWQHLQLGAPAAVGTHSYLCASMRLRQHATGADSTLLILYPERRWRDALWSAVQPSLWLGLAGCIGALALALVTASWLARRVHALAERTRPIASGDFRRVPVPRWNDELRDVAVAINDMAQQLAQLQEAARAGERLRLLGQVSAGLAHQMRNSVAGMRLAMEVNVRGCGNDEEREGLSVALRQLALMEEKLQRFLHMGGDDRPAFRPCSLSALLDETIRLLAPRCRHTHVDLRWQPPPASPIVMGDSSQLGHLLVNVLGNAVEAAGSGGWVEVHTHVDDRHDDARAVLDIVDSGPGPPAEVAAQMFEQFVTSKPEGVGLGLAVARRVAEAHGGSIAWQRDRGRTHFRIVLPVVSDRAALGITAP